ncbi:MAG: hypothetical protein HC884_16120 [Chloroflexaceae bacterium]|nr:hypothetical protein [Chloroflexaceae bacterium]
MTTPFHIHGHRRMLREVALAADAFYKKAEELGQQAFASLGREKRSQITGLESLANSTQKTSDVFNYIKTRTARQKEWRKKDFGKDLLLYLETTLATERNNIVANLKAQKIELDAHQQKEVYLLLIRAFVAQLAAQYEFAAIANGEGETSKTKGAHQ